METDQSVTKSLMQDYIAKLQDIVEVLLGTEFTDEEWGREILRAAKSANEIKFYFMAELSDMELEDNKTE